MLRASLLVRVLLDAGAESDSPLLVTVATKCYKRMLVAMMIFHSSSPDFTAVFFRKRDMVLDDTVAIGI